MSAPLAEEPVSGRPQAALALAHRNGRRKTDILGWLFLAISALIYHGPLVFQGLVPTQDDVEIFFFPILVATADALRQATLRLWTPLIFGGYPLFADGEAGMLYPLNLLVLPWASPELALVLLQLAHSFLSAGFTYYLLRTLQLGALASVVGALVYAYSGFAAGQVIHGDVVRSLVWLPLELAFVERMCLAPGATRWRYAVLAGAAFGIQALALHVHITLLSALAVGAFVAYRWLALRPNISIRGWWLEGLKLEAALGLLGALGVGLAAVQLLPLWEISTQTYRGAGLSSALSAPNSVWPGDLATLLLPHLHDVGTRDYWGPWVKWETVLYVGVLPLVLALVGLFWGSGRYRLYWGLLLLLSVFCAFGTYGPLPLWDALHQLPGFNVLKSPGRFSLLVALAVAVTAAYGVEVFCRSRPSPSAAVLILLVAVTSVALTTGGLALASGKLETWSRTGSILVEQYLLLPGVPRIVEGKTLTPDRLASYAAEALDPRNPRTAGQLGLVAAAGLTVSLWLTSRRLRPLAAILTVGVVFADLWVVGLTFHPTIPVSELRSRVPDFLRPSPESMFRVLTLPTEDDKVTQVDPNRLIAAGVQEAGGYSSLPPDRAAAYLADVLQTDDDLLNLWNVRYLLRKRRPEPQPDYAGVSFHPTRPLLRGKEGDRGRIVGFLPDGGPALGEELLVVAALVNTRSVPDGAEVARIRMEGVDGGARVVSLVAGRDVSDATVGVPGASGFAHGQAEVAFSHQRTNPDGEWYGHQIFFGRLSVGERLTLRRATVEQTLRSGRLQIFGLGLYDRATNGLIQVWDREDRPLVYTDDQIKIAENRAFLSRAFLVPDLVELPPGMSALDLMHDGPFDPHRAALVEWPLPAGVVLPLAASGNVGIAAIEEYRDERVVVRTRTAAAATLLLQDAYFPGWVARIDGERAPVLRANYLFRAVPVPVGEHLVTFTYEPDAVAWGLIVTLASALVILSVLLAGAAGTYRASIRRSSSNTQPGSPAPS